VWKKIITKENVGSIEKQKTSGITAMLPSTKYSSLKISSQLTQNGKISQMALVD